MTQMPLPQRPDAALPEVDVCVYTPQRAAFWQAIGELNYVWSNNESVLIYFIKMLLRTDEASAAVVFATLNTTRARLDLIARLGRLNIRSRALAGKLRSAITAFNAITKLRNEFSHSVYVLDSDGDVTHTQSMRLHETRRQLSFGLRKTLDDARLRELNEACLRSKALNRTLWLLLPELDAHLNATPADRASSTPAGTLEVHTLTSDA